MQKPIFFALSIALVARMASAWSINGHLIVAGIAEKVLQSDAPNTLSAASELLTYYAEFDTEGKTDHEGQHAFVETATFADDVKYHGEAWQSDFHFLITPFIEEGSESDYEVQEKPRNLTTGLTDIVAWLSGKKGAAYKKGYMYTYLMSKFSNDENVAKSFALRLLIHYIGDLVQPFHCENRYNHEFPKGDKGANMFPLPNHYDVKELHALWDKVLYAEKQNIARPFDSESWSSFQQHVEELMSTYAYAVKSSHVYKSTNYDKWAQESFDLAKTLYTGLTENEEVPEAYLEKNVPVAYERLIIGGYRLSYTLQYIFGAAREEDARDAAQVFSAFTQQVVDAIEARQAYKLLQ